MRLSANPQIARKITRLYLVALTAVALLSVGGQVLVQQSLESQQNDSKVINIAGRQRMLSQKISKTVLLLLTAPNTLNTAAYAHDLSEALALWQKCHAGLKSGYLSYLNTPVTNSSSIRSMFAQADPYFQTIYTNAHIIEQSFRANNQPASVSALQPHLVNILQNEAAFLRSMDRIVFQYDAEASQRVNRSRQIEYILLIATLSILLLEGLFIFRPAVNQIQYTIGLLISSGQNTHKINEELVRVNQSLKETKEALLEATNQKYQQEINEQKLRSAYLVEGQEEERKRVALEIHDGLGQLLTALKYGIEKISSSAHDSERTQKHLAELRQLVGQTISEARTISYNLMPAVLSDFGISSALKLLTSQVGSSAGLPISFHTNLNGARLAKNVEIGLYRVSQEAIHNAVKYAGAGAISVDLCSKKKFIHLKIADDGRGFNYDAVTTATEKTELAHGISNMKERVFMMNGQITIQANPGQGTQIHVKIPNQNPEHV